MCQICGFVSETNVINHIVRKHNMTKLDYQLKFPGYITHRLTEEQQRKIDERFAESRRKKEQKQQEREKKLEELGDAVLICKICGFKGSNSLVMHISRRHMTVADYKLLYPDAVYAKMSEETKKDISKAVKQKMREPDVRERMLEGRSFPSEVKHWVRKGFSQEEAQKKVSEFQAENSKKGTTPEHRQRMSEKNSGDKNPMSLPSIAKRENVSVEEAVKLTPCYGRTGEKHPMYGKHHTDEAKCRIAENMPQTFYNKSFGELELQNELKKLYDKRLNTNIRVLTYNCDIVFQKEKVIVEYMGEFWHPHPKKFKPDWIHPRTKQRADEMWAKDDRKIASLQKADYHVIVVRGDDWAHDRERVLTEVKYAIDRSTNC